MGLASDQNGSVEAFVEFAPDADVLVMHMVVPEGVSGAGRALRAPPGRIGEIASQTGAGTLVLSHFMARNLQPTPHMSASTMQGISCWPKT